MRSSNKTLADALRILAQDIESADWVANAALREAADRIDELSSEVEDLRNQNQEATDRIDELAAEVDDLRNQNHYNRVAAEARLDCIKRLEEATQDRDKEWFQVIESILGFHPVSITDALRIGIERIKKQKQRIKRLEEAGDELAKWADRNTPVTILNDWTRAKEAKP